MSDVRDVQQRRLPGRRRAHPGFRGAVPAAGRCGGSSSRGETTRSAPSVPTTTAATRSPTARPAPRSTHALAVGVGGLVRGPPGALEVLVLGRLDEHLDLGADALLGALGHQLVGQRGDPRHPRGDRLRGQLAVIALGLGAVLVGVAEHADRVEPRRGEEGLQLGDVVLGLAGEPDDHVAADARLGGQRADPVAQVEEVGTRAEPAHPAQHRRAGVLERQVEVRRDAGRGGDRPSSRSGRTSAGCR